MWAAKLLDLLLILVPVLIEWWKKKRTPEETATQYVRRVQNEKLKTYEALQKDTGEEMSRLSWERIHMAMLGRVREVRKSSPNGPNVQNPGA